MQDLFRKLEQPALVDLALQWPGGIQPELATNLPGDVYSGDPIVILARLPSLPSGTLRLSGRRAGHLWQEQLPITLVDGQSGLSKLWARERIGELSRLKSVGGDTAALQAQMLQLALQYQVVSEYTSLVAVDHTPARPANELLRSEQAPTSAPVKALIWVELRAAICVAVRALNCVAVNAASSIVVSPPICVAVSIAI